MSVQVVSVLVVGLAFLSFLFAFAALDLFDNRERASGWLFLFVAAAAFATAVAIAATSDERPERAAPAAWCVERLAGATTWRDSMLVYGLHPPKRSGATCADYLP